jgi:hypothetical protein
MTPAERAKAIANSVRSNALDDLETTARLAIRAAIEDEREAIVVMCHEFAALIDPAHGGDAIRQLAYKIRERAR